MNKLLKLTLIRVIGSAVLSPFIFAFLLIEILRPWVIQTFLFGSTETAVILAIVLSALPLFFALAYLFTERRSLRST